MRPATRTSWLIASSAIIWLVGGAVCVPEQAPRKQLPTLQVTADLHPILVSPGSMAQLRAVVTGGTSPYTYQWTQTCGPPTTITAATSQISSVQFPSSGQYCFTVMVTDSDGTQVGSVPVVTTAQ